MNNLCKIANVLFVYFTLSNIILSGQSLSFEELASYGHTEIHEVYRSPNNDIYVISNLFKVYKSEDDGQSWTIVENVPESSTSYFQMEFLDNGEEIFIVSKESGGLGYYMDKNGVYENVMPDSLVGNFSNSPVHIFGNTLSVYKEGKLFKTEDNGDTFTVFEDNGSNEIDNRINENQIFSDNSYGLIMSEKGELFAHSLKQSDVSSDIFQASFYAPNIDSEFIPSGGGPAGTIFFSDATGMLALLKDDNELYYKESFSDNFKKLEIIGQDFERIYSACFDNQGRLLLGVDWSRILRVDLNNISVSASSLQKSIIELSPNPSSDFINLKFGENSIEHIHLVDVNGKLIKVISKDIGSELRMDISTLESGIYFVIAKDIGGFQFTQKVIKI